MQRNAEESMRKREFEGHFAYSMVVFTIFLFSFNLI